jgi:hypothetical protein
MLDRKEFVGTAVDELRYWRNIYLQELRKTRKTSVK